MSKDRKAGVGTARSSVGSEAYATETRLAGNAQNGFASRRSSAATRPSAEQTQQAIDASSSAHAAKNSPAKRKLLDQVRDKLRTLHYPKRTEEAYVDWIRRYLVFHGMCPRSTSYAPYSWLDCRPGWCPRRCARSFGTSIAIRWCGSSNCSTPRDSDY